jgi:DNA-binding NarL/FixJ family response regulator
VSAPLCVALVDDYDIVLVGLAQLLDGYRERVVVAEIDSNEPVVDRVDIVLYDSFAQPEADLGEIGVLVDHPGDHRVVVYTWNFQAELIDAAFDKGASGYLSKTLPAAQLVEALEAIHAGETVVSPAPGRARPNPGLDWPGKAEGLTSRESEVLALITQGKSNAEVAALTDLS